VAEVPVLKIVKFLALAAVFSLAACKSSPAPTVSEINRDIYPDPQQAGADLAAALKTAAQTHKRVLLDFGGNWCGDCMVLDLYLNDPSNRPLLEANFVLVDVNVGHMDANRDIATKYDVPIDTGVPALAVLDANGALLYSQKSGEFRSMRNLQPAALTSFLEQWKPGGKGCSTAVSC
jgi:thioredoxin 1